MDVIRRNSDYALRLMLCLAANRVRGPVSTAVLASEQDVSYALACKILQRLQKAGLVRSCMGARGGFEVSRHPSQISVMDVIGVMQGPVRLNRCLSSPKACTRHGSCPIKDRLTVVQRTLDGLLASTTLQDCMDSEG